MAARLLALSVLVALGAVAACPRGIYNDKICSGYGHCGPTNLCTCDERHYGVDCSQTWCPFGAAWFAPARAPDIAHFQVECSNRGHCDRATGLCVCMDGYTGAACQRLACAGDCNNGGDCLSLLQLSARYAAANEQLYNSVWDAEKIYGCDCHQGFQGYDCSKHSCPRGDDPLTTGQVNEVQVLRCTASSGRFTLNFRGRSIIVPYDATAAQFERALHMIDGLANVKVTYSKGTTVCSTSTAENAVLIEFLLPFGPQAAIKVFANLKDAKLGGDVVVASGGTVLAGKKSVKGTKEWAVCSNRGDCDEATGKCTCYTVPMPGYRSSDGYGNIGLRGDCGSPNDDNLYGGPITACPGELACSGHGYCSDSPFFKCMCERGWESGDCSSRTCAQGPSWFAIPDAQIAPNPIHSQFAECSNAGTCERATGECQCYSPFTGDACDLLKCPGDPVCSGHGQCMSIREVSLAPDVDARPMQYDYGTDPNNATTYDRYAILGCKCDPGYEGYDCSRLSCPRGDDPTVTEQVDEVQVLQCVATGGVFYLQYRTARSTAIAFDATPTTLRAALINSLGFQEVGVVYSNGTSACAPAAKPMQNTIQLTFPVDHNDLPALLPITTGLISNAMTRIAMATDGAVLGGIASRRGVQKNAVCSNKGICNHESGRCRCAAGYGSSDGRGNQGSLPDCGYILPEF